MKNSTEAKLRKENQMTSFSQGQEDAIFFFKLDVTFWWREGGRQLRISTWPVLEKENLILLVFNNIQ